jgi:hypothetical protein
MFAYRTILSISQTHPYNLRNVIFQVILRECLPPIPPAKPQISRSATVLLSLSKLLTNIFRTANNLTYCKTTNHVRAGHALDSLVMPFISCDRSSIFEQDF